MDVQLEDVDRGVWHIMVCWPGRSRYRRVGTLKRVGWQWKAYEGSDNIERDTMRAAVSEFLNTYVLGDTQHTNPNSIL